MAFNSLHTRSTGMLSSMHSSSFAIVMASCPYPLDQETLLYFATFLADAKGLQHGTIISYLYGVQTLLHINMGLSDPLKGDLHLHKCLQAIHIQSNPESRKLAFMYDLLVLSLASTQVSSTASLMGCLNHGPLLVCLQTGKFTVDQECFDQMHDTCTSRT